MGGKLTYHCDDYEDAEQNGQAEVLPRELPVCSLPGVRPIRYVGRHPASAVTRMRVS
jgi:hypothetical protein